MLDLILLIPGYWLFQYFGWPRLLPKSLTISVTSRCNSRCKTCRIYESRSEPLTVAEYEKVFRSLGSILTWVTMSGGEPFLREDLPDICGALYRHCRPAVITIPTNGLLNDRIPSAVQAIAASCPAARIIVNLSLDGIGAEHDEIRGVPGCYEKALSTYQALKGVQRDGAANLSIGIHTVISKFNVSEIPRISGDLISLQPDSYITEIAEQRVELKTLDLDITPGAAEYRRAINGVIAEVRRHRFKGLGRVVQSFRAEYYDHVADLLLGKPSRWPCHAGFASAQIMPDGEVWACCIKGNSLGNLRREAYDFKRIWLSDQAEQVRRAIKEDGCRCPLANAAYTNILLHPPTMARVTLRALASLRNGTL
ncbi:MAG TPA: radical SAM protein [Syntrophobacteria bacterium]|nr:radical SAM protein [Syntrophobacteria bacterium]